MVKQTLFLLLLLGFILLGLQTAYSFVIPPLTPSTAQPIAAQNDSQQAVVLKANDQGHLKVTLATKSAGEDLTLDVVKVEQRFSYDHRGNAGTTVVKPEPGFLHCLILNQASGTITLYDNTAASGQIIAQLGAATPPGSYCYDVNFGLGLTLVQSGASDVTLSFR